MFSGIVEGRARIRSVTKANSNIRIMADFGRRAGKVKLGDSVSVNGVCLSVVAKKGNLLGFDAIAETLRKTNLGSLNAGDSVNYETSMSLSDVIGGHLVTGHIDGTGKIMRVEEEGGSRKMVISVPASIGSMVMEKGLIAVDGISLTPAEVSDRRLTLYLIPDTLRKTTISGKRKGDSLNIEVDFFGKYIQKFVKKQFAPSRGR